jgi:hypothetical protein
MPFFQISAAGVALDMKVPEWSEMHFQVVGYVDKS